MLPTTRMWIPAAVALTVVAAACEPVTDPAVPETGEAPWRDQAGRGEGIGRPDDSGRFIVTLAEREDPRAVAAAHGVVPEHVYTHVLNGFAGSMADAARSGLLRDARVVSIDKDIEVELQQQQGSYQWGAPWGLDRIDQRSNSLDGLFRADYTGRGVTAYIVDSGINYAHGEFEGRASLGIDYYGGDGSDCHGHGTHVAGTVGGRTYGVAKDVRLVSVKTLGCYGSGSVSIIIAGLDWIAANATGPSVVNLSVAAPVYDPFDRAVQRLTRKGIAVVVAAANYTRDACEYSPAREPDAITVGASTLADARAWYSNFGSCVDLFAPGDGILSADYATTYGSRTMTGTSMSAPHVTGVAALYLERNPGASAAQVQDAIKAASTQGVITDANSPRNHLLFVDLAAAAPPPAPPPPPPAPAGVTLGGNGTKQKSVKVITLEWTGAEGTSVDIRLNDAPLATVPNSGTWTYENSGKGRSTFEFQVCEREGARRCSNRWSISL